MFIALALTLLLTLSVLRHALEPSCPSCAAKRWRTEGDMLTCARCEWSSAVAPQPVATAEPAASPIPDGRYAGAQY